MAFVMTNFEADDFESWKQMFDSDPVGRKQTAKGHQIFRSVENPNHVFVGTEFESVEDAKAFRERLLASDALANGTVHVQPTVTELADAATY
jgi:heme-degrading monooxygenase HmoA